MNIQLKKEKKLPAVKLKSLAVALPSGNGERVEVAKMLILDVLALGRKFPIF